MIAAFSKRPVQMNYHLDRYSGAIQVYLREGTSLTSRSCLISDLLPASRFLLGGNSSSNDLSYWENVAMIVC